jgi:hypothetical protein
VGERTFGLMTETSPPTARERASGLRATVLVVAAALSAGAGFVAFVGFVFSTSCDFFSTAVGGYAQHMGGGIAIAAIVGFGLWLTSVFLAGRNMDRLRYLFVPFVGFVLSYLGILIVIAEVAKAIWGPMQCRDTGFGF